MQHQQPGSGGGVAPPPVDLYGGEEDHKLGDLGIAEAASPISSRPPASAAINFEEMLQATAEAGGGSSGNRWPRQETLALLQIRSEMDAAFRDATLKGPLWEQVSRKLGELGYNRSAKKCKEKFENVHKYYKRTKEGRGGRQDGKTYKFFTQLEALNLNIATATTTTATPVASFPPPAAPILSLPPPVDQSLFENIHLSLSSDSSSSSDDEQEMEMEMETNPNKRKRKRERGSTSGGDEKMMDFFEGLLKQVMQKQEGMQHKFLEAIEKREQDRMIREEAWKRQDLARLAREHDLMAQERAVSASRDAAIVSFLEKITGQTIHLPTAAAPPPPSPPPPAPPQPLHQNVDKKIIESPTFQSPTVAAAAAAPEQRMMVPFVQQDLSSSRWPKTEVLALIQLRSGMDTKYQDVGPKGVLWEEISAGMQRLGYNRSAKRCKEKWENINKYFKKVKESNKKRPEDAKTCPYFHELDALYRKKAALGSKGQTSAGGSETGAGGAFSSAPFGGGDDNTGGENQPEDMLIRKQNEGIMMVDKCSNNSNSDNNYEDLVDENEEEIEYHDDNDNDYDEKTEDEMKMLYKIQFSNGGGTTGTGTPSNSTFITMQVQ